MKRRLVLHPVFFALFPVLFLFSVNMDQFGLDVILKPGARILLWTLAGWAVLSLVLRNIRKAALVTSLFVVLYFSFGHAVNALPDFGFQWGTNPIRTAQFVQALLAVLFVWGAALVIRTKNDLGNLTRILNFVSFCLVLMPLVNIQLRQAANHAGLERLRSAADASALDANVSRAAPRPHIFYIILDGYGRADNLKEVYGYDNSQFIDFLESRGFFVAAQARTNYSHTRLSVACALNMEYLDGLAAAAGIYSDKVEPINLLIRHSKVRGIVSSLGYRFVSFATGFDSTEIKDADTYMKDPSLAGEFERGLADMTPALSDAQKSERDRRRIMYAFEKLPELAESDEPLFVFAHIIAPHPPYVFSRDGGASDVQRYYAFESGSHLVRPDRMTRPESMRHYLDQLVFITEKTKTAVDAILARSRTAPIVMLQGDHGPCCFLHHQSLQDTYLQDRMSILSAYHLPNGGDKLLHGSITPVNTFRVIFDYYFRTGYKLIADRSFYSRAKHPYRFIEVTDDIGGRADRQRYERLKGSAYFETPDAARGETADSADLQGG